MPARAGRKRARWAWGRSGADCLREPQQAIGVALALQGHEVRYLLP